MVDLVVLTKGGKDVFICIFQSITLNKWSCFHTIDKYCYCCFTCSSFCSSVTMETCLLLPCFNAQDLIKHTDHEHPDKLSLQMALAQMEAIADFLNESKRAREQVSIVQYLSSRVSSLPFKLKDSKRWLLRQDVVTRLVSWVVFFFCCCCFLNHTHSLPFPFLLPSPISTHILFVPVWKCVHAVCCINVSLPPHTTNAPPLVVPLLLHPMLHPHAPPLTLPYAPPHAPPLLPCHFTARCMPRVRMQLSARRGYCGCSTT